MSFVPALLIAGLTVCLGIPLPGVDIFDPGHPASYSNPHVTFHLPPTIPKAQTNKNPDSSPTKTRFLSDNNQNLDLQAIIGVGNQDSTSEGELSPYLPGFYQQYKPTTTENPLEILLTKIYNGDSWKSLLTDGVPPVEQQQQQQQLEGFYQNQVSGGAGTYKSQLTSIKETTEPASTIQTVLDFDTETHLKTNNKVVHHTAPPQVVTKQQYPIPRTTPVPESHQNSGFTSAQQVQMNPLAMMGNKLGIFYSGHQPAQEGSSLSGQLTGLQYGQSSGENLQSAFNPNEINRVQHVFNPDRYMDTLMPQTGSDPSNQKFRTSYNADDINRQLFAQKTPQFQAPTGYNSGSQGKPSFDPNNIHFSANSFTPVGTLSGSVPSYDADALNTALLGSQSRMNSFNNPANPGMGLMGSSIGISDQQNTEPSNTLVHPSTKDADHQQMNEHIESVPQYHPRKQKELNPTSRPFQIRTTSSTTDTVTNNFHFVPGNLFPGQSISSFETGNVSPSKADEDQGMFGFGSGPVYLQGKNNAPAQQFNPNAINAAQSVFNPNKLSWINSRAVNLNLPAGTPSQRKQHVSTATTEQDESYTKPMNNKTVTSMHTASTSSKSGRNNETRYPVFDPNKLNSSQGQASFVPGQLVPDVGGNGFIANYVGATAGGHADSFGTAVNIGGNDGRNFDPNALNQGFATMFGSDNTRKNSSTLNIGVGFANVIGGDFDPNAASAGFGASDFNGQSSGGANYMMAFANSFQSSHNISSGGNGFGGYGFGGLGGGEGSSGFDPNASNMGFFNASGGMMKTFGGGLTDFGTSAFNPNKVNAESIMNPFVSSGAGSTNQTKIDDYMSYLLGGNNVGYLASDSAFTAAFDPDSVNTASYDPNKFNKASMNFSPLEMLLKNQGLDEDVLNNATFSPDSVNNIHVGFNPIAMLSGNPVISKYVLDNSALIGANSGSLTSKHSQTSAESNLAPAVFDPIKTMENLMQNAQSFQPGTVGSQQLNFEPSSMFGGRGNLGSASSVISTITTTPVVISSTTTATVTSFSPPTSYPPTTSPDGSGQQTTSNSTAVLDTSSAVNGRLQYYDTRTGSELETLSLHDLNKRGTSER